jgi:purine-binding chemotaxis protein CheW
MTTKTMEKTEPALRAQPARHLIFSLGDEFYGIPVLKVREIIRLMEITPVPRMPPFVRGVINLRGQIVPVLDLRLRLKLAAAQPTRSTCIVVAQVTVTSGNSSQMGLVVDAVDEVLNIPPADIQETPEFATDPGAQFLCGIAKAKGKVVALLDVDRLPAADSAERTGQNNDTA